MSLSFICLASLFFLHPCLSSLCPPLQPYKLPCNTSIEIKPPFFVINGTNNLCKNEINIKCNYDIPRLRVYPFHTANVWFSLENIVYSPNKLIVSDPTLENELNSSSCGNLQFSFLTPSRASTEPFDYNLFLSLSTNIKSFCGSPNLSSQSLIFGGEYTLNYSATTGEHLPSNCSRKTPNASFEWKFSFDDDGILILLSAKYSYNILSQQGCFSQSIVGGNYQGKTVGAKKKVVLIVCTATGSLAFIVACLILILQLRSGKNWAECILWSKDRPQENIEMLLEKYGWFAPKRYKYAEVKKITCSFQDTLGKGGFGTVYKGRLQDGCLVAVKILHSPSSDREELLNEILYEIEIGIARGLEYLHRGCNARIVQFDIKPQNILLDEDFNPRIAYFGLAKLCPPKESIISMAEMRGTIGYIAPEVFSRSFGVVSTKSDVYSYGMMMLEMVGGRRNAKPSVENPSQVYFPHWLYDRLVEGSPIQACDVLSIETEEIARKMGMVGLWCTQTTPSNRPSMNRVVEMLEKSLDELEMPPKPYLCSPPHSTILSDTSHTPKFGLNSESDSDCLVGVNTL
ncbi:putative receptor-like protein kinase [Carex littledalei]|uniref:Putative receptor-like protein kinase n=1 Tax=Carex littledalei TaxID=544730 RepID=A0A833RIH9_9POAL|nr:putative receptor-like protein kinase [Carex littledalei]